MYPKYLCTDCGRKFTSDDVLGHQASQQLMTTLLDIVVEPLMTCLVADTEIDPVQVATYELHKKGCGVGNIGIAKLVGFSLKKLEH